MNQYLDQWGKIFYQSFIDKYYSRFTIVSIILIYALLLLYIICINERKMNIDFVVDSSSSDGYPPSKYLLSKRTPSIHIVSSSEEKTFENISDTFVKSNIVTSDQVTTN